MSPPNVVVPGEFTGAAELHAKLRADGYDVTVMPRLPNRPWTADEIERYVSDADAIITMPTQQFPGDVIRAAKRLLMIGSAVIGVDHIDVDAATEQGVIVTNCPVREMVVGMAEASVMFMAALLLQLERKQASLRAGNWRPPIESTLLLGKTVGLIAYGRIARAVEERLQGWGVTIQAYDPFVPGTVPLETLLKTSDVVSIHAPRTSRTMGLLGRRELALMKPTAILINTSRGGVVDEAALAEAIDGGRIAGAALDVFEQEPPSMDNPLFRCDPFKVLLTPHGIGHSVEAWPSFAEMSFQNVQRALRGELPESVLNPEAIPAWQARFVPQPAT